MLIYAGIDEAGYGPMLGPLVVAGTAFSMPDQEPEASAPDLWRLLSKAVCRSRADKRHRIAVDDSKNLKGQNSGSVHPLKHLERGVLSFLGSMNIAPSDDDALYQCLNTTTPTELWYDSTIGLPVSQESGEISIATSVLQRAMESAGIRCEVIACEAIDAGPFNRQAEVTNSKAAVNLAAVFRLIEHVRLRWSEHHPRIVIDRQGGRSHYLRSVQQAWPEAEVTIVAEEDSFSRYQLNWGDRSISITFTKEAEARHLPVALASMTAKYVRELMMIRLNRFFATHLPELKPTAGYVQDARRYLREIRPVIRKLGLPESRLVRVV